MNVLLISANTERLKMPTLPLGLSLVAAAVRRAGHQVLFLDLLAQADPVIAIQQAISTFTPHVIGISVRNVDDQVMEGPKFLLEPVRDIIAACRALTVSPIVLGGAGYSMFPNAALTYLGADYGIDGEGEVALPLLLDRLQQGRDPADIPGVYVRNQGVVAAGTLAPNLDELPWPDDELFSSVTPNDPEVWVPVQSRRGCPMACSYCSTPNLEGRQIRRRSPQSVAQYVARVAEGGFRQFYFVDNTFNLPPSYALELCRSLKALKLDIAWRCILYPHNVPEELVAAMAEAGCVEVSLGFESGCPDVLRAMNKRFQPQEVREISQRLAAHGIRRMGFLLLGGPCETKDSVKESIAFADSLNLEMLSVTAGIRIYPQTPLAKLAVKEGMIEPEDDLLQPRFYMRPELKDFIAEAAAHLAVDRGDT
jgi:radical SAM superfamily enzyme YgiQ (UPF0313 family)